ncbi:MAG: glycosaminoglycan attachment site [Bacteroidales bacterium]|nr:glycosaminoglycan attachment site [Bacteroidales bacterium]
MKNVISINRNLFNIYLLFTRNPFVRYFSRELEFYSNGNKSLIGFISLDYTDNDFNVAILSRDKSKQYRAGNMETSIPTIEKARRWIDEQMNSDSIVMHNDESEYFDLFEIKAKKSQISQHFKLLKESEGLKGAKEVIKEISYHYKDIDGNFIEQFQSNNGFDSRIWELYLFCLCREELFSFKRNSHSPDFMIEKLGTEVAIEAVIVARKNNKAIDELPLKSMEEIEEKLKNKMPLMFGSALFDKLKKEYWKLDHVKGKPFLIAIADFHEDFSMTWSFTALSDYLYGYKYTHSYDKNGELIIIPVKIKEFVKESGARIPAGFFFQPNSENISAVLFSSTATIGKFNRMGKQAGLGSSKSTIIRMGACHNFDDNASVPNMFQYQVDEDSKELWSEGVSIFHNPNALIPLDKSLFPSVAHHELKDEFLYSSFPEFFPYNSFNQNIVSTEDEKEIKSKP